jgi:putative transposase
MAVWCEVWDVGRSGFYAYAQQQATLPIDRAKVAWRARVKAIPGATRLSYGRRGRATQRQAEGFAVGRAKARRLRQKAGPTVRRRTRRGLVTPESQQRSPVAPNLLARQCEVEKPHQVWAGDRTSSWTAEGG